MTQGEIVEMVEESGWIWDNLTKEQQECILHLVKLVSEKEREACAFLCDELWRKGGWDYNAGFAADCIRAKGKHK